MNIESAVMILFYRPSARPAVQPTDLPRRLTSFVMRLFKCCVMIKATNSDVEIQVMACVRDRIIISIHESAYI
jgi:hypothetical protein